MKIAAVIIFIFSLILNVFLLTHKPGLQPQSEKSSQSLYPYLSKRIFVENQNDTLINFVPLREAMRDYVDKIPDSISVYFEYLPSGVSIGINEKDEFVQASLIKVPVAMAIYKEITKGRINENQILTVQKEHIDSLYGNLWKKGVGTKITVKEAISLMLTNSDNTANRLLSAQLPEGALDDVYNSLDIPTKFDEQKIFPIISAKNYTSIFRSLYLSAYINREYSNNILRFLTQSVFDDKLVAGVSDKIEVAHKIGVFKVSNSKKIVYSDCGIIYFPRRPYMLCVMFNGNEENARTSIKQLSKMVYGYIEKIRGGD